ncbi:MAG TPA: IS701 family transposase [Longimicrobiales bacterium]|nr:IS701 family transposase [Longimicrobiales bacterium]
MRWLEPFQRCFGHRAQRVALRTYVQGVFSDSDRKSMQAMLARVTEPVSYQAFQHFITHAPWDADQIWRRLLAILPERRGVLIIDGTSFPKQGPHSVGVARQYCGALGKIANCQVAVTAALWTGTRAWLLGALLYLPQSWSEEANRRAAARIPATVSFQEKWRQALTLIRRARAAGLHVTAVVADAEFGDITAFRRLLHQWRLPYALGVSRQLTVFRGTPAVHIPPSSRTGRPRSQLVLVTDTRPITVRAVALALPARAWRRVTWRNGTNRPWAARFAAVRVTPANEWRNRRLAPEVWLLCEQDLGLTPRIKYFFVHLPATASIQQLVRLAHQRWAIEQQYQELKTELGLDHFEGRSYPGWHHHVVLTAVAYAFLQRERMRPDADPALTLPAVRAIVTEIFTALLFAQNPSYLKRIQELQNIQLRI